MHFLTCNIQPRGLFHDIGLGLDWDWDWELGLWTFRRLDMNYIVKLVLKVNAASP